MDEETTPTKVYKLEVLIVDHDDIGADEIKVVLENQRYPNHCINPEVMSFQVREVEWSDEHPLNYSDKTQVEYQRLFGE